MVFLSFVVVFFIKRKNLIKLVISGQRGNIQY